MRIYAKEDSAVIWGEENSEGGTVSSWYRIEGILETFDSPDPEIDYETLYYEGEVVPSILQWKSKKAEGKISYLPYSGKLWEYALGEKTMSGSKGTIPIDKDLTRTLQFQYYLYHSSTPFYRAYKACWINRISFSLEVDGIFSNEMDIMSLEEPTKTSAESLPSRTEQDLVTSYQAEAKLWNGGDTITDGISRAEFELNNNLFEGRWINMDSNGYPSKIQPKRREITGRFTLNSLSDSTLWEKLKETSTINGSLELKRTDNDWCLITASNGRIKTAPYKLPDEGPVEVDVDIAFKDLVIELEGNWNGPT